MPTVLGIGSQSSGSMVDYCREVSAVDVRTTVFYVDDTTLLFGGRRDDLQQRVSESLLSLQNWLSHYILTLYYQNSDKSVLIQYLTKNKLPDQVSLIKQRFQ